MLPLPHSLDTDPSYRPFLALSEGLFITPRELARHWRLTIGHLAALRRQGKGPAYVKIAGRVVYRHSDILAFELRNAAGPVTPDSLAIAMASIPALSPKARDLIAQHLERQLFRINGRTL